MLLVIRVVVVAAVVVVVVDVVVVKMSCISFFYCVCGMLKRQGCFSFVFLTVRC